MIPATWRQGAYRGCAASSRCTPSPLPLLLLPIFLAACVTGGGPRHTAAPAASLRAEPFRVHARAAQPGAGERQCAWFGDTDDGVLYFGESAFWWALRRSGGDPRAVLETRAPRRVGRFDLASERMLEPLDVAPGRTPRSGVWDVLPVGGRRGRVYFTTYFGSAGFVDLPSGRVTELGEAGTHLNELAPGPEPGQLLVTRYADAGEGGGAVLVLAANGTVVSELRLEAPPGEALAAKSVAWDPVASEIWVTTDRLPIPATAGGAARPTLVLGRDGRERRRFGTAEDPTEIQFVRFGPDGSGALAWVREGRLELVRLAPDASRDEPAAAGPILLDPAFPAAADFAQDIQLAPGGRTVVTRWSGRVHVVDSARRVRTLELPRRPSGLYYSAVAFASGPGAGRVCATRCDAIEVVCTDLAPGPDAPR